MSAVGVRVFISSTFRDMHAERDHLVTVVFPELRERVERLGFEFYDVDLRWGVPQTGVDGERANSWAYCKKWIDRVQPFFVGILGQRYGWIPRPNEIPDAADAARYHHMSITEMEIQYAVLSKELSRRSFFYFRRAEVPKTADAALFREFVDPDDEERLEALRRAVERSGRPVRHYDCRWTGAGFEDLDGFGRMVLEDLWSGVLRDRRYVPRRIWRGILEAEPARDPAYTDESRQIPQELADTIVEQVRPEPRDPWDAEREDMEAFARSRVRWYRGGGKALGQLRRFVTDDQPTESSRLCVVIAPPGSGKSSLLARLAERLAGSRHIVITHFIGVTERSADVRGLLARLLHELDGAGIPRLPDEDERQDVESLKNRFQKRLAEYSERRLVLVIDALNQLTDDHDLDWLPRRLGASVRMIVSTVGDQGADAATAVIRSLEVRRPPPEWVSILPLSEADVRRVVVDYLEEYSKELDREQLDAICAMREARNPLYLLVMLGVLRTLGGNDMNAVVPQLVAEMRRTRPDVVSLFDWMLERFEVGFGEEVVRSWFAYLVLARTGFSSRELSDLLGRALGSEAANSALLVERGVRQYLLRRGAQLDFLHGQLREAAGRRYLPRDPRRLHAEVARYLDTRWPEGDAHAFSELCHHQTTGHLWRRLSLTLCDLDFLQGKCRAGMVYDLVADYDAALTREGLPAPRRAQVKEFSRFVRADSHLLSRRPELLLQQALNQPDGTAPATVARHRADTGAGVPRTWLAWLNKPETPDPGLMTLEGHGDYVNSCDVSPDGRWIISSSTDKTLKLWDAKRGRSVRTYEGSDSVESCAFSPDGSKIISGHYSGLVMVWDVGSGITLREMEHADEPVPSCAWSPSGNVVASVAYDNTVKLWNPLTERPLATLRGHGANVLSCSFSPDGRWIVSGDAEGRMKLWDVGEGKELPGPSFGHGRGVWGCAFSPNGQWIISASEDGSLRRWHARSREQAAAFEGHEAEVWCCAVSSDGSRLLSGSEDTTVRVWNMATGHQEAVLSGHVKAVWGCAFVPGGDQAVSASWDASLKVWDATPVGQRPSPGGGASNGTAREQTESATGLEHRRESSGSGSRGARHRGPAISCEVSPDGRLFLSGAADGTVTVWDADNGSELFVLEGLEDYVSALTISPDGRWVVSGDLQGNLRVHDLATRRKGPRVAPHEGQIAACAFSPDGTVLATGSRDESIRLWDVSDDGFSVRAAFHAGGKVESCVFSSSGLIWGRGDGALQVWDPVEAKKLSSFPGHPGLLGCAVTQDGAILATVSEDATLKLWDVAFRREIATLAGHTGPIQSCAFSPDGTRLASASWDRTVRVWDTNARIDPTILVGHTDQLQDVRFSADGTRILSAALDGTLRLWDARSGAEIALLVGPASSVDVCTYSGDGRRIASSNHRQTVKVWNGSTGRVSRVLSGHAGEVRGCAFSPDGTLLASTSSDKTVKVWNTDSGRLLATLRGYRAPVQTCAFSPDGSVLASGSWDSTVRLTRGLSRRRTLTRLHHPGWVEFVGFTDGGTTLVTGSRTIVKLWDWRSGVEIGWLEPEQAPITVFELSSDGRTLACGCRDGTLIVRDLVNGHELNAVAHQGTVHCCSFSGDGGLVVTGGADGLLKLWNTRSREQLQVFHGHQDRLRACAVSIDGRRLASGAEDGFLRVWDASDATSLGEFWSGAAVTSVCWRPEGAALAAGDSAGRVHVLLTETSAALPSRPLGLRS
jgi:WD40 repeat protein